MSEPKHPELLIPPYGGALVDLGAPEEERAELRARASADVNP
ncbi:MAG TPA: hypothetical protein VGB98_03170 [Pyrinomonadaceae bacterium]|jgi:hypothetical protein